MYVTCRVPCHGRTLARSLSLFAVTTMSDDDQNPRPTKRVRLDPPSSLLEFTSSLTPPPSSPPVSQADSNTTSTRNDELRPLPPAVLLVSLPSLLAHPPNHRYYVQSLYLSLCALRKCLTLPALSPEIECRAWTSLAEIGMKVVHGGLSEDESCPWAKNIETEVSIDISWLLAYAQGRFRWTKRLAKG